MSEIPPSFWLDENNSEFPKLSLALTEPNGLIAIGGNLSVERLLKAYSLGIFPWYGKDEPILWYSPDPRMVITPEKFHLSKSLKRVIQSSKFEVCIDTAFKNVIVQCQKISRKGQSGTWINDDMIEAIVDFMRLAMPIHTKFMKMGSLLVGSMALLWEMFFLVSQCSH